MLVGTSKCHARYSSRLHRAPLTNHGTVSSRQGRAETRVLFKSSFHATILQRLVNLLIKHGQKNTVKNRYRGGTYTSSFVFNNDISSCSTNWHSQASTNVARRSLRRFHNCSRKPQRHASMAPPAPSHQGPAREGRQCGPAKQLRNQCDHFLELLGA